MAADTHAPAAPPKVTEVEVHGAITTVDEPIATTREEVTA